MKISDEVTRAFYLCYINNPVEDPHQAFADCLGMGRFEAKQLCYRVAYEYSKSRVIKQYLEV